MKTPDTIPEWKLERFALGELPAEELARLQQRLQGDVELQQRLEALRGDDAQVRSTYPTAWMARQLRARQQGAGQAPERPPSRAWLRWGVAPLAAAALLAIVALPAPPADDAPARLLVRGIRSKGSDGALYVHRRTPTGTEQLQDGSTARRGDLVRLQYRVTPADSAAHAAGAVFGTILSMDGGGTVTRHLPLRGDSAVALAVGELVNLDAAYELDAAPAWERFVLVTSPAPFDLAPVLEAAADAVSASGDAPAPPAMVLPEELTQVVVTLVKVTAPAEVRQP